MRKIKFLESERERETERQRERHKHMWLRLSRCESESESGWVEYHRTLIILTCAYENLQLYLSTQI